MFTICQSQLHLKSHWCVCVELCVLLLFLVITGGKKAGREGEWLQLLIIPYLLHFLADEGMATSLGSTEKCNWLTCPTGSPKPQVRKKVGTCPATSLTSCSKYNVAEPKLTGDGFQTRVRKVRLCCWCWSGEESWLLLAGYRLRSWEGPSAVCTPEDKVRHGRKRRFSLL